MNTKLKSSIMVFKVAIILIKSITVYFWENIKTQNFANLIFGTMQEGLFPDILHGVPKYFIGGSRATFFKDLFFNFIGYFFRNVAIGQICK